MKWCSHCDRVLRADAFAASESARDGLQNWCRCCKSRVPVAPLSPILCAGSEKTCSNCKETLPLGDFSLKRKCAPEYGRQVWCKQCVKIYKRDKRRAKADAPFERMVREQNKRDYYETLKNIPKQTV